MGWYVVDDCDLGRFLTHGGGYPGYGSNVVLLPEKGVGVFWVTSVEFAIPERRRSDSVALPRDAAIPPRAGARGGIGGSSVRTVGGPGS